MKAKHQRLILVVCGSLFLCLSVLLTLRAFRDNLVFFYSPADVASHRAQTGHLMRVGGLVKEGSIMKSTDNNITFEITDGTSSLSVHYKGLLPNLFRAGQGIVAEGKLADDQYFEANTILAKHDENYMPKEVVDALKRSGRWKGEQMPAKNPTP